MHSGMNLRIFTNCYDDLYHSIMDGLWRAADRSFHEPRPPSTRPQSVQDHPSAVLFISQTAEANHVMF